MSKPVAKAVIATTTAKGSPVVIEVEGSSFIDTKAVALFGGEVIPLKIHSGGIVYSLASPREGATHYIQSWNGKKGIGLNSDEAKRVSLEWREFESLRNELPDEVLRRLRSKRESLSIGVKAALDEVSYRRERAYERDIGRIPQYETDKGVLAAQKALHDFDVEHPEIVEMLKREKEESITRHMWD